MVDSTEQNIHLSDIAKERVYTLAIVHGFYRPQWEKHTEYSAHGGFCPLDYFYEDKFVILVNLSFQKLVNITRNHLGMYFSFAYRNDSIEPGTMAYGPSIVTPSDLNPAEFTLASYQLLGEARWEAIPGNAIPEMSTLSWKALLEKAEAYLISAYGNHLVLPEVVEWMKKVACLRKTDEVWASKKVCSFHRELFKYRCDVKRERAVPGTD